MFIGVDEAGRGAFCGSLIVGFSISLIEQPITHEIKDSKLQKLPAILKTLAKMDTVTFFYQEITPPEIDTTNINQRITNKINAFLANYKNATVFIDEIGGAKYLQEIKEKNPTLMIFMQPRMDQINGCTRLAGMYAKKIREEKLTFITNKYPGIKIGYPAHKQELAFLEQNFLREDTHLFRWSWAPLQNIKKKLETIPNK